jgi:hypothetical protein
MIHDLATSAVKPLHKMIHKKYRMWIGLAKSAEGSILYRPTDQFGLGFVNLIDMHQQHQVIKWHIMKCSKDLNASGLYKYLLARDKEGHVGTGRKTTPRLQLEIAERQVTFDGMLSNQRGTAGLGLIPKPPTDKKSRRKLIVAKIKAETNEKRLVVLHGYEMQNGWMHYGLDKQIEKDLTWRKVLGVYNEELLKFVVNGTTNTLNTPDNLRRWNICKDLLCGLCGHKNATLRHVLAGCPWVFEVESKMKIENRYLWRHNCVLMVLARAIIAKIAEVNTSPKKAEIKPSQLQSFVKAGQRPKIAKRPPAPSILDKARDWVYDFDLPEFHQGKGNALVFPYDVLITKMRIDGYIVSREKKICILGPEITSPMDDNVLKWHKFKTAKYRENVSDAEARGWTFYDCSLETGALGWIPPSNRGILKSLGFTNAEVRSISNDMQLIARRCSYVMYLNRFTKDFQHFRISPGPTKGAAKGEYFDRHVGKKPCAKVDQAARAQLLESLGIKLDKFGLPIINLPKYDEFGLPVRRSCSDDELEQRFRRLGAPRPRGLSVSDQSGQLKALEAMMQL